MVSLSQGIKVPQGGESDTVVSTPEGKKVVRRLRRERFRLPAEGGHGPFGTFEHHRVARYTGTGTLHAQGFYCDKENKINSIGFCTRFRKSGGAMLRREYIIGQQHRGLDKEDQGVRFDNHERVQTFKLFELQ